MNLIEYEEILRLHTVISGGQTGADQAGLFVAKEFGFKTGGFAPRGFRTLIGNNPNLLKDEFGLVETTQLNYQNRTAMNVKSSDLTIRLASNFNSSGEICTLNAIRKYGKPYFDVDLKLIDSKAYIDQRVHDFIATLMQHNVATLNVAGNADHYPISGFGSHFKNASKFLRKVFSVIREKQA